MHWSCSAVVIAQARRLKRFEFCILFSLDEPSPLFLSFFSRSSGHCSRHNFRCSTKNSLLILNYAPNKAPLRVKRREGFSRRDIGCDDINGKRMEACSQFKAHKACSPNLRGGASVRSATMPSASQAAASALEARREVRAGRPSSLAPLQLARSAWSRGVPGVLVHRRKVADKRRLRSRCALRRSPPLAQLLAFSFGR